MKAIKAILITLLVLVLIVVAAFFGAYFYVRSTYGIDLFRTADQLKTLNERVDESTLCPNAYGDGDFVDMKDTVNAKLGGLIVYQDGKGYNGYYVDFQALAGKTLTGNVSLTEKQVGAIAQTVLFAQTGGKLKLGDKEVAVSIVQVDFPIVRTTVARTSMSWQSSIFRRLKRIWTVSRTNTSKVYPRHSLRIVNRARR